MGGITDTLFAGGQGQGYGDLQKYIRQGMGARNIGYGQSEQALNPFYTQNNNQMGQQQSMQQSPQLPSGPFHIGDMFNQLNASLQRQRQAQQMPGGQSGSPLGLQQFQNETNRQLDPGSFINQLLSHYQQSPYARDQIKQGTQALEQSAASGGLLGSSQLGKGIAEQGQRISNEDRDNYLRNALGIYNQGYRGLGQQESQGFDAAQLISALRSQLGDKTAQDFGNIGIGKMGQDQARAQATTGSISAVANIIANALSGGALGGSGLGGGNIFGSSGNRPLNMSFGG